MNGDDWLTVLHGDCRDVLRELADESVNCVVTSPPYWGLRDYGTAQWVGGDPECPHRIPATGSTQNKGNNNREGTPFRERCERCDARRIDAQIGLEATPEEYVETMVAVFREVRRVLRNDGTLWLNLGSTYFSSGGERTYGSSDGATGRGPGTQPERVLACGTGGTEPRDCSDPDCACRGLCDGCRAAQSNRSPGTDQPRPAGASPLWLTGRDTERSGSGRASAGASPLDAPASTTMRSETQPPGLCSHCDNCGACLSVLRSAERDARLCARSSAYNDGTETPSEPSAARTSGRVSSGLAWGDYTSTLRSKNLLPIPWMVAMALQADGWILRRDVIWSKPNPMPESVTDRPTSSHEYLFLLSREPRYYFDADAVREPYNEASLSRYDYQFQGSTSPGRRQPDNHDERWKERRDGEPNPAGRNIRSVWTIATQPYPGAHFATFPPKLVEPCILAGCPEGGVVLDPFAGTGTVGMVAQKLSRRAVLIDLNADYLDQLRERNRQIPVGLTA